MTIIRCLSSHIMSSITQWRNGDSFPDNQNDITATYTPSLIGRMVVAEIGMALTTVVAAVECVAIATFTIIETDTLSGRAIQYIYEHITSCFFTVLWGTANVCFFNFQLVRLDTDELDIRENLGLDYSTYRQTPQYIPYYTPFNIYSFDNTQSQLTAQAGANFIWENIISPLDNESKQLYIDCDPSVFNYTSAKAIFLYTYGEFKTSVIPQFLKWETQRFIQTVRARNRELSEERAKEILDALSPRFESITAFQAEPDRKDFQEEAFDIYKEIREAAFKEIQGGKFVTDCLNEACRRLPTVTAP